jgi:hypothetical protein
VGNELPQVQMMGSLWDMEVEVTLRPLRELLGGEVRLLYRANVATDEEKKTTESVFVLEKGEGALANGRWAGREALALLTDAHRAVIETYWREQETGDVPVQRSPWAQPGWFAEVMAWIEAELAVRGQALVKPVEMVRSWSLSYVLKVTTTAGVYYLKTVADLPLFVNEAALVGTLSRLYPRHVPTPLSSNLERDWMLLPELPEVVGWKVSVETRQAYLCDFGRLQITAVADVNTLLAAGCLDRRLARLPEWVVNLFCCDIGGALKTGFLYEAVIEQCVHRETCD